MDEEDRIRRGSDRKLTSPISIALIPSIPYFFSLEEESVDTHYIEEPVFSGNNSTSYRSFWVEFEEDDFNRSRAWGGIGGGSERDIGGEETIVGSTRVRGEWR